MKLPVVWLRDFVDAPADVRLVADRLAACGFEVAGIDGDVIDLEVTANRPDCLTITGLAREVATAFGVRTRGPMNAVVEPPAPNPGSLVPVTIEHEDCGRFTLAVLDVKVGASPPWLADRLAAAGVRPINNIVDVTNYVMLEVHPMHAFDAAKLAGPELRIRLARPGESLKTLDGQTRALDPTMLVVADRDRPVSIAGIMGGANSEVSPVTTRIALEAAWWRPSGIRRTSRRLSLKTEAAARFERGADIDGPIRAIARALELLESIGAGRPAGPTLDVHPHPALPIAVTLRREALARLLGDHVPDDEVERILASLGFALRALPEGWDVGVPTFRVDVRREADLVEEVGRHWGFNRIPATFPPLRSAPMPATPAIARDRTVGRVLTGAGLQEAATFTFIEEAAARPFVEEPAAVVPLANPLSEKFAVLRPSLLPGLLDALIYNRRREAMDVRLFEAGSVFGRTGERHAVAWVLTGGRSDHWSAGDGMVDIFDAKGIAELVAQAFGVEIAAEPIELPWFVPGRAARLLTSQAQTEGAAGELYRRATWRLRRDPPRDRGGAWSRGPGAGRGGGDRPDGARVGRRGRLPARRAAAAVPVNRARSLDSRRRTLACCGGSWHDPLQRAADARGAARVRSVPGSRRAGRQGQFVVAAHVPGGGSDADRCRSADRGRRGRRRVGPRARRGPAGSVEIYDLQFTIWNSRISPLVRRLVLANCQL